MANHATTLPPNTLATVPALNVVVSPSRLARLTALEVGITHRLLEAAWIQNPCCTIPDDHTSPAEFAGITPAEWLAHKAAVLRALEVAPQAAGDGGAERQVLLAARRVYDKQLEEAASIRAMKREAGKASAAARAKRAPPTGVEQPLNMCSTAAAPAPSLRSDVFEPLALSFERSTPQSAIQGAQRGDPFEVLGAGARAQLEAKVKRWQHDESLEMLQNAIAKWNTDELTDYPVWKASELANGVHSTPDRVDYLVEYITSQIKQAKSAGRKINPTGLLISGLGMAGGGGEPYAVSEAKKKYWRDRQASQCSILSAQAAINRKIAAGKRDVNGDGITPASARDPATNRQSGATSTSTSSQGKRG